MVRVVVVAIVALVARVSGHPGPILDFEADDHHHEQEGDPGSAITGSYGWTSPEGVNFLVRYVADKNGYRVLESNAVPLNADGVYADGTQGSFTSYEDEK
ncbi:Cuticular protein 47Eg-like 1 [Homarus americanus]|uniref:Cuticular protein 47Eg-like 1 n=1 Tax=Homarus americanus TaxID=6706 RepID=A0A8J5K5X0_HOMAM|nr:Cuticular protein 47Eg-like 1 [Homarus americanus]